MMFYLFRGEHYYPGGGAYDFVKKSEFRHSLLHEVVNGNARGWWHIADENMVIVEEGFFNP